MSRTGTARGRYVFANDGVPTGRGLQGVHILRDGSGCQIYKPSWKGTRTIVRPIPVRNPDNPAEWDSFRISDSPHGFGDWIRRYDMAFSIGVPGITFITQDPRDREFDAQQNPVWMLHRAIPAAVRAAQAPASWGPLVVGQQGRPLPISAPKDGYVMQCVVVERNSKPVLPPAGSQPQDQTVIFLMSQSAGEALIEKLMERDAAGNYLYDNITDLDAGMFIQFHQAGSQQFVQGSQGGQLGAGPAPLGSGGQQLENRYAVEILPDYNGISAAIPHLANMLAEKANRTMWDNILHVPTIEEQVRRLCHCGLPASAVVYALSEVYADLIPGEVLEAARTEQSRAHVPFNVMQPQQQEPQQPAVLGAPAVSNPVAMPGMPFTQTWAAPQAAQQPAQPVMPQAAAQQPAQPVMPQAAPQMAPQPQAPAQQTLGLGQMVSTPPAGPPDVPFDVQPTHASESRQQDTMAAVERARARAAGRQANPAG
jgi:hypothetical protein